MKVIYKYPVMSHGEATIKIVTPGGSFKPLCVQLQNGVPQLWAELDVGVAPAGAFGATTTIRQVVLVGTGSIVRNHLTYAGTFQLHDGTLVWHVYVDCREVK